MQVHREVLTEPALAVVAQSMADSEGAELVAAENFLFDGRSHIQALIDASRLPMLAAWVEARASLAWPLLDLGDDPEADCVMPFLLQLSPGDAFLRFILTVAETASLKALWGSGAVILLRQDLPAYLLRDRLRKSLRMPDDRGRMHYLRFWDGEVVADLLESIAEEGRGFRGPFSPGTELLVPGPVGEVMRLRLRREAGETDGSPIRITAELRQLLAGKLERRAIGKVVDQIVAAQPDGVAGCGISRARLEDTAAWLLTQGWPLRAAVPVLRVISSHGIGLEAMPPEATRILLDLSLSHTARGRIFEREAPGILARNASPEAEDIWRIS